MNQPTFCQCQLLKKLAFVIFILTSFLTSALVCSGAEEIERSIDEIMSSMTLEQKIGQMVQGNITHVTADDVARYYLGSVLNGGGSWPNKRKDSSIYDWLDLADEYYKASIDTTAGGAGIPIIWGTDAVHGHNNVKGATLFPHNVGLGAMQDSDLVESIAQATAREVAVTGLDWVFAPTIAIAKDLRWGRAYESYSDNSRLVGEYSSAMIRGLQGLPGALKDPDRVIATAKHFIGDGGTMKGVDQGDTQLNLADLLEVHGAGYRSAIEAGTQTIMASFNSWNGDKIHGNRQLLTEVLKQDMEFDGFVVGDWDGHGQVAGCTNASCPKAIIAGIDMFMVPKQWKKFLSNTIRQVRAGEVPMARIDDAVRRILRVKIKACLFSKGPPSERLLAGNSGLLGSEEHRAIARNAVRDSIVLLKNNGRILPLRGKKNILIGGDGSDNIAKQSGGWTLSWQGNKNSNEDFPGATSIFQGLKLAIEEVGGSVAHAKGDSWQSDFTPDIAVVVFGEDPYAEGVGDREDLLFCDQNSENLRLVSKLREQNIPIVSVMLTGRPLMVNSHINRSDAFVVAWLPGSEGGGVADVLVADATGKPRFDFTGKLPFPWPNTEKNLENPDLPVSSILFERGFGRDYEDDSEVSRNLSTVACERKELKPLIIFNGITRNPFTAYIAESVDNVLAISGSETTLPSGSLSVTTVDGELQEDSRRVSWSGVGESRFFWQASSILDWRDYLDQDGALSVTFMIEKHPEGSVQQELDCGISCSGTFEMGPTFKAVPKGQWVRSAVPLRCLAKAGADLSQIRAPFVLKTEKKFSITIKDLRVATDLPKNALLQCD